MRNDFIGSNDLEQNLIDLNRKKILFSLKKEEFFI